MLPAHCWREAMLFVKKLPCVSLLLLVFTYGVFGWLISIDTQSNGLNSLSYVSERLWLDGAIILLLALSLTAPFQLIQTFYKSWLKSDTTAFVSVIVGAFFAVVILHWFETFIRILVLLSAGALVRIDLQTAGYNKWQSFGILMFISLMGFSFGIILNHVLEAKITSLIL